MQFEDGTHGAVDLSHLVGKGVFRKWEDYQTFCQVRIGPTGELAWGDELDLCPDALYLKVTGRQPEDLFPSLNREPAHA
ncbi:DUF2442 domain-containing protein [Mycobacterium sp.]|uniref:DUF2442 domain-containing protein n=1 Tax=Mycobacterium sp. TaxID=1785 RepID=UPI003F9A0E5E